MTDIDRRMDYSGYQPKGFPVRHRKKVPFEPTLRLGLDYRRMVNEIRNLDDALGHYLLRDSDYADLAIDALSDNTHWSTKVEGNTLSSKDVKDLTISFMNGRWDDDVDSDGLEIINHLFTHFNGNTFELPWTIDTVMDAHASLMRGIDGIEAGTFRAKECSVVTEDGFELFIACPSGHIEEEMRSLIDWLNYSPYDEIITSVLFFHEFESIHPFEDGNGRTGRLLCQMMMRNLGIRYVSLCRYEHFMLSDWPTYCNLLGYTDATGDYAPLVMYYAESMLSAYRDAVRSFEIRDQYPELDGYQREIISKARTGSRFTIKEANMWVPKVGDQTLRSRLDDLVDRGLLKKQGATRGMTYVFSDPFSDIRWRIDGELVLDAGMDEVGSYPQKHREES